MAINDGSTTDEFKIPLLFTIEETPNAAAPADMITLPGISGSPFDVGERSTLQIKGFRLVGSTETLPNFITSEEGSTAVEVFGKIAIRQPTSTVPEPSTILLFGSGLAGLAGWRRFRGKHRTN